jgi:hypothetical protein
MIAFFIGVLIGILIGLIAGIVVGVYLLIIGILDELFRHWSLSQDEQEEVEYARYEVNYIHISGEKMIKYLYLDAGGINLEVGFCKGSHFIYDAGEFPNRHPCNTNRLIYGATDIVSFKKVK